jgi:hypothetical protein
MYDGRSNKPIAGLKRARKGDFLLLRTERISTSVKAIILAICLSVIGALPKARSAPNPECRILLVPRSANDQPRYFKLLRESTTHIEGEP